MRRALLLISILAPLQAAAQPARNADALCTGLHYLVAAAPSGFDYVPRDPRQIPGSIEERRGIVRTGDGPPRAVFYAVMLRDASRERPNPVQARFRSLQAAIARCLPDAQAAPVSEGAHGAMATWTLPQALIALRRDDGEGFASTAELELSVAARW